MKTDKFYHDFMLSCLYTITTSLFSNAEIIYSIFESFNTLLYRLLVFIVVIMKDFCAAIWISLSKKKSI